MKKILTLVACLSLVASLAIGGSIAYLTATDRATNTFTIGNVSIKIQENLDGEESSALPFVPGTTTTKEVSIKNDGVSPAYVWLTISLDPSNAADYLTMNYNNSSDWTKLSTGAYLYNKILSVGETTSVCLESVSFNSNIDIDGENLVQWVDKEKQTIGSVNEYGTVDVFVNAYAIQADGITSPEKAYNLYFDQTGIGGTVEVPATEVNTASDLMDALAAGDNNITLTDDISLNSGSALEIPAGVSATLNLNGHTLTNSIENSGAVINRGTLKIVGGTILNNSDCSTYDASDSSVNNFAHAIINYGTLTLDNVNAGSDTMGGNAVRNEAGTITINGGTFTSRDRAKDGTFGYVFYNKDGTMTINNATSIGRPNGMFSCNNGTISVNGGTYTINPGSNTWYMALATGNGTPSGSIPAGTINLNSGTFTWNTIYASNATHGVVNIDDACVINWSK